MDWVVLILITGAFLWIYIHDRKIEGRESRAPSITVNVHIDKEGKSTTGYTIDPITSGTKKSGEIPIQAPKKTKNWKDIKITDSFDW